MKFLHNNTHMKLYWLKSAKYSYFWILGKLNHDFWFALLTSIACFNPESWECSSAVLHSLLRVVNLVSLKCSLHWHLVTFAVIDPFAKFAVTGIALRDSVDGCSFINSSISSDDWSSQTPLCQYNTSLRVPGKDFNSLPYFRVIFQFGRPLCEGLWISKQPT